jgi:hypothetical protein
MSDKKIEKILIMAGLWFGICKIMSIFLTSIDIWTEEASYPLFMFANISGKTLVSNILAIMVSLAFCLLAFNFIERIEIQLGCIGLAGFPLGFSEFIEKFLQTVFSKADQHVVSFAVLFILGTIVVVYYEKIQRKILDFPKISPVEILQDLTSLGFFIIIALFLSDYFPECEFIFRFISILFSLMITLLTGKKK